MRPEPPQEEKDIGLLTYMTDVEPLGGKIKSVSEDFVVNEISDKPAEQPYGDFTIASVSVKNWETNRLIKILARYLGISKKRIGFAGTKDKRAITTQLMSFKCPEDDIRSLSIKDVRITDIYRSNRELTIGDLLGNDFRIKIRNIDLDTEKTKERAEIVLGKLVETGGYPNFFGIQRFGSVRPITHIIGRHILKREFEEAIMTYIGNPLPKEIEESRIARDRLEKERDFMEALEYYPKIYSFERSMIHHLAHNPDDWIGALEVIPDNLKMMFVHAYQSYLFNMIVSKRIEMGIPISEPVVGDVVLPLNKKNLPDHYTYINVTLSNLDEIKNLVRRGLGFVSGVIMGNNSVLADGVMGEIENQVVFSEGIEKSDYEIFEVPGLSSKGIRREILSPLFDLKWKVSEGDENTSNLDLMFSLYRGSYATSMLREVMKGNYLDY